MKVKLCVVTLALAVILVLAITPASQACVGSTGKSSIERGLRETLTQSLPYYTASQPLGSWLKTGLNVNIIFVGIGRERIDLGTVSSILPQTYIPIVRDPMFYGIYEPMNITFNLKYNFIFADKSFSQDLFSYISSIGSKGAPTHWQTLYSQDPASLLKITSDLRVSAKDVEAYLIRNLYKIRGVVNGCTLFFLDGYTNRYMVSHGNFVFHTYYFNEPDPDTGEAFGLTDASQGIAWGGTLGRVWFYDFSAGPEYESGNWNVTNYWLAENQAKPPIWHYVKKNAYHLSPDVGEIARFIAINLLFTPSPLYKPLLATKIHINAVMFENASQVNFYGKDWFNATFTEHALETFEPYKQWRVTFNDSNLMEYPELNRVFVNWAQGGPSLYGLSSSWEDFYWYYYQIAGIQTFLDPKAAAWADHSIPVFAFAVPDQSMGIQWGLLGLADDDYTTGTQTYINAFASPEITLTYGYGYTATIVHESGHHIGLSHPHDGYDSEMGLDYDAEGYYQFVWDGDESYTVMSYVSNAQHFGQFNKDSLYRDEGAMYLQAVAQILRSHPNPNNPLFAEILSYRMKAVRAFYLMDYYGMVFNAHQSYLLASSL
jgi:hypothetical protein